MAFQLSALLNVLKRKEHGLLSVHSFAGEEAYICGEHLLTPWSDRNVSVHKYCFNLFLLSPRIVIEQTFGILVAR